MEKIYQRAKWFYSILPDIVNHPLLRNYKIITSYNFVERYLHNNDGESDGLEICDRERMLALLWTDRKYVGLSWGSSITSEYRFEPMRSALKKSDYYIVAGMSIFNCGFGGISVYETNGIQNIDRLIERFERPEHPEEREKRLIAMGMSKKEIEKYEDMNITEKSINKCEGCGRMRGFVIEQHNGRVPVYCKCDFSNGAVPARPRSGIIVTKDNKFIWMPISGYRNPDGRIISVPALSGVKLNGLW